MVIIQVCVGSSCHLKGAPAIVEMLQKKVEENKLEDDVVLTGSVSANAIVSASRFRSATIFIRA